MGKLEGRGAPCGSGMLLLALLGGSPGALLGMWTFRHKTRHWYFKFGLPAILLAQITLGPRFARRVTATEI